ncbi:MAG: hypothetical protein H6817_02525 [Phycisphaerales bacterium]|nr:hypothetical protein [Phycisphaerales bacterium]
MTDSPDKTNAIPDVLDSCRDVVRAARHVRIDDAAVEAFARRLVREGVAVPEDELALDGSASEIANFVLITDALNFCFWGDAGVEPWAVEHRGQVWTRTLAMVAGMLRAVEHDRAWLTAQRWAAATDADVADLFAGKGGIPMPQRRREILCETGAVLHAKYDGQFTRLVAMVERDALALARKLAKDFPSFHDVARYGGKPVALLKRAQICAADLHRAWASAGHPGLANLGALTVFADYRLPQLFRHEAMMVVDNALAARIDAEQRIDAGSDEEIEIRAATVVISQLLCEAMTQAGRTTEAWELDYELWRRAREPEVTVPHHRTVTHFY